MRSRRSITVKILATISIGLAACAIFLCVPNLNAQSVALVTPNGSQLDKNIAVHTSAALSGEFRVQNLDMTEAAFRATALKADAFNMTTVDARDVASVLGCDFYILIRTGTQRRASVDKSDHFESFATFYLISGRTGRLIKWQLVGENGDDEVDAEHRLTHTAAPGSLNEAIAAVWKSERDEPLPPPLEPIPEDGSLAAKSFRPPVPYRRLKPEYTRTAYLYNVTATIEATLDLDEKGQITRLEITRWAGYDLDESVVKAIRSMNWRPAERGGKPLPVRFLLRYNFKKIEKDDPDSE